MTMNESELYALKARLLALGMTRVDISVGDQIVVLDVADAQKLVERVRPREVLVAEITSLLVPFQIDVVANLAERIIDRLGVALLVEGDKPQTALMRTGGDHEMSLDEFLAREGIAAPRTINTCPSCRAELGTTEDCVNCLAFRTLSHVRPDTCVCGHLKSQHIYHEGACRPGFACTCTKYQFQASDRV